MNNVQVKPLPDPVSTTTPTSFATPRNDAVLTSESAHILATTDYLWKIYGVTNDWIKSSDTKAAAVLSANAILTGAAVNAFNIVHGFNQKFLLHHPIVIVPTLLALLMTAASIGFCLYCIYPRLKYPKLGAHNSNIGSVTSTSLVYFGHIAERKTAKVYEDEVCDTLTDEKKALNQISEQVWVNSIIATKKLRAVSGAIGFFSSTLFFVLVAVMAAKLSH